MCHHCRETLLDVPGPEEPTSIVYGDNAGLRQEDTTSALGVAESYPSVDLFRGNFSTNFNTLVQIGFRRGNV